MVESKGKQCGSGEGSTFRAVVRKVCGNALFKMKRKRPERAAMVEGLEGMKGTVQGSGKHIQYHRMGMHTHGCAACVTAHVPCSEGWVLGFMLCCFLQLLMIFLMRALPLNFSLASQII